MREAAERGGAPKPEAAAEENPVTPRQDQPPASTMEWTTPPPRPPFFSPAKEEHDTLSSAVVTNGLPTVESLRPEHDQVLSEADAALGHAEQTPDRKAPEPIGPSPKRTAGAKADAERAAVQAAQVSVLKNGLVAIKTAYEHLRPLVMAGQFPEVLQRSAVLSDAIASHEKNVTGEVLPNFERMMKTLSAHDQSGTKASDQAAIATAAAISKAKVDQQLIFQALRALEEINLQAIRAREDRALQYLAMGGMSTEMLRGEGGLSMNSGGMDYEGEDNGWNGAATTTMGMAIAQMLSAYFSDDNLAQDQQIKGHMQKPSGWVEITYVSCLPRMVEVGGTPEMIFDCLPGCPELEVSDDGLKIRIRDPVRRSRHCKAQGQGTPSSSKKASSNVLPRVAAQIHESGDDLEQVYSRFAEDGSMRRPHFTKLLKEYDGGISDFQADVIWQLLGVSRDGSLSLQEFARHFSHTDT